MTAPSGAAVRWSLREIKDAAYNQLELKPHELGVMHPALFFEYLALRHEGAQRAALAAQGFSVNEEDPYESFRRRGHHVH